MAGCGCELEIESEEQRRVLITLLAINATMFLVELSPLYLEYMNDL